MGWIILIIVGIAFVVTLIQTVPPQAWLVLLVIAAVIVFLRIRKSRNERKQIINDPKFQELLKKTEELKAICERMQNRIGKVWIDECEIHPYTPICAYEGQKKKQYTLEDARQSRIGKIFFQVVIKDDCSSIRRFLDRYIEANRNGKEIEREVYGERLLEELFRSKSDAREFCRLTYNEVADIAYDCIDLDVDFKDYIIFHFELYMDGYYDKEKVRVLLKEIHALDDPKKQAKRRKAATQDRPIMIPTYGQGNVQIYQCPCGTKFRVPADKGRIVAHCPNKQCKRKWLID